MKEYKYNDILFFIGMPVRLYEEDETVYVIKEFNKYYTNWPNKKSEIYVVVVSENHPYNHALTKPVRTLIPAKFTDKRSKDLDICVPYWVLMATTNKIKSVVDDKTIGWFPQGEIICG